MAFSGGAGGYVFQTRIGKGCIIFTSKFFFFLGGGGGPVLKHYTFFENHRPHPWGVINDRSLSSDYP